MLDWTRAYAIAVHVLRVKAVSKSCSKSMFGKELTEKELAELRAMLPDTSNRLKGITP